MEWMKRYRVWEANRKVFLYPENWLEPELRDEKSPFFKELEDELRQNDITNAVAEAALTRLSREARQSRESRDPLHVRTGDQSGRVRPARVRPFPEQLRRRYYYRTRSTGPVDALERVARRSATTICGWRSQSPPVSLVAEFLERAEEPNAQLDRLPPTPPSRSSRRTSTGRSDSRGVSSRRESGRRR